MAVDVSLDPARTAVLSMDMQAGILALYAGDQEGFTQRAAQVLRRARDCGMTIIHVQVGFRPGFPEIGTRNRFSPRSGIPSSASASFRGRRARSIQPSRRLARTSSLPNIA
jgi:nicotinamidase-related amidase